MDIAHPAHVHLLKNTYFELKQKGHRVIVTVKDIPSAITLLDIYQIPYIYLGNKHDTLLGKAFMQLKYNVKLSWLAFRHNIDIGFGSSLTLTHISRITRMSSIILDDDDDSAEPLFVKYAHPYANVVLSPDCTLRATPKAIFYNGYHELAYLHPNWFTPDPTVLQEIGLTIDEPYFILRFNAFKAHHDVGVEGLTIENKRKLVWELEKHGKVFITSEKNIDPEFKKYQLLLSPEKIHSLIYYATLLVGDSQTMTSEAAVLGTPAVKCNSFAGVLSVPNELETKYKLCFSFKPDNRDHFFSKIEELLSTPDLKAIFSARRKALLADKIDVTTFYCWFVENYPASATVLRKNPDFQSHSGLASE